MPKKLTFTYLFILFVTVTSVIVAGTISKSQALQVFLVNGAANYHVTEKNIDDDYSKEVFDLYIERLDPNKLFFTQYDLVELSIYKTLIDNEIKKGEFNFFQLANRILTSRINELNDFYPLVLDNTFSFNSNKYYESDTKKINFAKNISKLKERWKLTLEYRSLNQYLNLKEGAVSKNTTISPAINQDLEQQARNKTLKNYDDYFERLLSETIEEKENIYFDTLISVFDSHTSYFPEEKKDQFDINISGKLEGIGAVLREDDDYIKVDRIVFGSASHKQGDLQPEDIILKVAQKGKETINLVGMRVNKAVQYIRGKKGTEVILTVKHVNGEIQDISIIRDIVEIEETYTKSTIISDSRFDQRIGYINIPKFYGDMNNHNNRNTTDDVKKALESISKSNVDGVILDLRYNEGGFLIDAIDTAGLFINEGPIVQIKGRTSQKKVLYDKDDESVYGGPLVILINSYSASASEILAAALQDYERAVIVGTNSFGKGTVQTFIPLEEKFYLKKQHFDQLGALKITIQKFYRINGGSTQSKGVIPDIFIPDTFTALEVGERFLDYSLPWDTISPANYEKWGYNNQRLSLLLKKSKNRINDSEDFLFLNNQIKFLTDIKNVTKYSLNIEEAVSEKNDRIKMNEYINNYKIEYNHISFTPPTGVTLNERTQPIYDSLYKSLKQDLQLNESLAIINDLRAHKNIW